MPMFTLSHLTALPPESMKSQVLQMVVDYLSELSYVSLTSSNPLYQLYQYVIGYETHLYLEKMNGQTDSPAQLILALDTEEPSRVIGFALFLTSPEDPSMCRLLYLGVQEALRQQGIARALLGQLKQYYPQVDLTCTVRHVDFFERHGFQVLAAQGPQLLLSTADTPSHAAIVLQDLTPIFQSLEVRQIHTYLLKQHGQKAMQQAEINRDRRLDQLTAQAQTLFTKRRH